MEKVYRIYVSMGDDYTIGKIKETIKKYLQNLKLHEEKLVLTYSSEVPEECLDEHGRRTISWYSNRLHQLSISDLIIFAGTFEDTYITRIEHELAKLYLYEIPRLYI